MKAIFIFLLTICSISCFPHPGIGIVMDSKKNVYYTDLQQVWKIDSRGKKTIAVKNVHTHELYIDADDNLFGEHLWYKGDAVDKWGHYVWRMAADGAVTKVVPDTEGFLKNYSFVRDRYGNMYWAEGPKKCQKLIKKNQNGKSFIVTIECFTDVRWMTAAAKGTVYLIDQVDLKKIDSSGHVTVMATRLNEPLVKQFGNAKSTVSGHIMGIWLDKSNNVYAAIEGKRVVKKITTSGKVSVAVETEIPWSPAGGFISDDGDLWLLESAFTGSNKVRVERISPTGKRQVY